MEDLNLSSLFIIGNGFDIAHGIPTAYKFFRNWLIEQYPDSVLFKEEMVTIEEYAHLSISEFAAETLVYAMDHASGAEWNDFEDALSRISFLHKLPGLFKSEEIESETEHNQRVINYLLMIDALSSVIIKSAEDYWPCFFSNWIKTVEEQIDNGLFKPHDSLKELFLNQENKYMTFNYTKTLQRLYNVPVVKHIHNRIGQALVFGHGDRKAEYVEPYETDERPPICSSFFDDLIKSFCKDTDKQIRKYDKFFKNLNSSIDKVYSYGFSYSKVDSPYIKLVINKISPNATWYFTEFEAKNTNEIRIKKIKLRKYGFKGSFGTFKG